MVKQIIFRVGFAALFSIGLINISFADEYLPPDCHMVEQELCMWNCNSPSSGTGWCGFGRDGHSANGATVHSGECEKLANAYIKLFHNKSFPNECYTDGMAKYGKAWDLCLANSKDGGKTCPCIITQHAEPTMKCDIPNDNWDPYNYYNIDRH